MSAPVVGFAGLTHLGIVSAVAAAARGFDVVGYSDDGATVERLERGDLPVFEPDLADLLERHRDRVRFSHDPGVLAACDLVYVSPDVPTAADGSSDLTPVRRLVEHARGAMAPGAPLVVLSQVPPGFTRALGGDPALTFSQVETLIFGRAVERALHPERFIVGCADPSRPLPASLAAHLDAYGCPVLPMRYESAELAKISINLFLVSSVTTTNTLADVCERVGADWDEIAPALRLDRRIGEHAYLAPGLGLSGGNLERDIATVRRLGDERGADVSVPRAWTRHSAYRRDWVLRVLHETVLRHGSAVRVGLWGLAYKQDTASTVNSPAVALLADLRPFPVRAYDPVVAADPAWHPALEAATDPLDACRGAEVLVVMTPWPELRTVDPAAVAAAMAGTVVVDPYRVLDRDGCHRAGLQQVALGAPHDIGAPAC